jgi:hypothetical protein
MNPRLTNIETIIKYINGDLVKEDISDIYMQLSKYKSFTEYFVTVIEIEDSLKDNNLEEFIQTLRKVHVAYKKSEFESSHKAGVNFSLPARSSRFRRWYKVAAFVLAILGLIFAMHHIINQKTTKNEKLFSQYYSPYNLNANYRSAGENNKSLQKAYDAYAKKDFRLANEYFNKLDELNSSVLFYKAISYIECGKLDQAADCLEKELKNSESIFKAQSHWYLALTFLKLNQSENACTHLKWLVKNIQYNNYYGRMANTILTGLKPEIH